MKRITLGTVVSILTIIIPLNGLAKTVEWTRVGRPHSARKIAACPDGTLYALNYDGGLFVNTQQGGDQGWEYSRNLPDETLSMTCGLRYLFFQKSNRKLWRLRRSRITRSPELIGNPWDAIQISTGNLLWALNSNRTLWLNRTGETDSGWQHVGTPSAAKKIAAARDLVFALNTDGSFWINAHGGRDDSWERTENRPDPLLNHTLEITASGLRRSGTIVIYRLDDNQSLWRGTIELLPSTGSCSISGQATGDRADVADIFFVILCGPDDDRNCREPQHFDSSGRYEFSGLPDGQYLLRVDTRADTFISPYPDQERVVCRGEAIRNVNFEFR
jgi:hypothetical protein